LNLVPVSSENNTGMQAVHTAEGERGMRKIRVAVLMGGRSSEREVSLSTGRQVLASLDPTRYDAFPVDTAQLGALTPIEPPVPGRATPALADGSPLPDPFTVLPDLLSSAADRRPDVALICLHGKYGEDGTIQGLLELLQIPYTGSGVLASALAIDKVMSKKVFLYEGIPTPQSHAIHGHIESDWFLNNVADGTSTIHLPLVVKPSREGSTIGISIVREAQCLAAALDTALAFDEDVLIEEFIDGIEITGPVLGNSELQCLPLVEIVPTSGFYDYEAKYTPGATDEIVPARLSPEVTRKAMELAIRSHHALGCRGFSRTDMIVSTRGIFVLEVNTIPGMTPTSLLPRSAAAAGIPFPKLLDRMIELALENRAREPQVAAVV
jgi:D-alanine-D-alanine ligase